MDIRKYRLKQLDRSIELLAMKPNSDVEKAIIDLEQIICDIRPYSRWWRWGYVKSLKLAIKALKEKAKEAKDER